MKEFDRGISESQPLIEAYTNNGEVCKDSNHWSCLAKKVIFPDAVPKFYLKRSTSGQNLYDPKDTIISSVRPPQNKLTGREGYEFVLVNEQAFTQYLLYLKTGNRVNLKWAQRELG